MQKIQLPNLLFLFTFLFFFSPTGLVKTENQNIIPVKTIRELDVNTYMNRLSELMVKNPDAAADTTMLEKMAKIGFVPGQPFEVSTDNFILK